MTSKVVHDEGAEPVIDMVTGARAGTTSPPSASVHTGPASPLLGGRGPARGPGPCSGAGALLGGRGYRGGSVRRDRPAVKVLRGTI